MYMNTLQDAKILQGVFLCSDIYVSPQGREHYKGIKEDNYSINKYAKFI